MEADTSSARRQYPIPPGVVAVPLSNLDLSPDAAIDNILTNPPPPSSSEKNVWFFWHQGYQHMHAYTQRNIRTWHRRFSKAGWTIRVLDRVPGSPLNVANFLDVADPGTFPQAFVDGTIGGDYAPQHTSDLVRWPLLLKYGGAYADVGFMQVGDLDRLWEDTVGDPESRFEVFSYNAGGVQGRGLMNYFLASGRDNAMFQRCHDLLLTLWAADGGKTSTDGMRLSPLLKGVPLTATDLSFEEDGRVVSAQRTREILTDYIIQGQAMSMVMGLVDEETGWDGPRYVAERVFAIEYMEGSQLINDLTAWDGPRQFRLMSQQMPAEGEPETEDQKVARGIVEACLARSFGFKLAHGLILKVLGETLGSLWRKHPGSDVVPGTYADWLRFGLANWCPEKAPARLEFQVIEPFRRGPLLREA